ncbi:MAG: glycosyltransferase family 2 protein [Rhodoglobus sp.]
MGSGIGVVISSYNQGDLVRKAVDSVQDQECPPEEIVVVDDGSTDPDSLRILALIESSGVRVLRQANLGVSAARNAGIAALGTPYVAVLDGDDTYAREFLGRTSAILTADGDVVAASSWLATVGVGHWVVRPAGGRLVDFLARNACPAAAVIRREAWETVGGYSEDLRRGFEDWDFFLKLLELGGRIEIVPEPLIVYRTAPASANVRSMTRRLELYGQLIDRHAPAFTENARAAVLALEAAAIRRLSSWERLVSADQSLDLGEVTYGDGGMAAAVRVATARQQTSATDDRL